MSHHLTPATLEEFAKHMQNPRTMTTEQKERMKEVERKIKALSPEERRDWLRPTEDD